MSTLFGGGFDDTLFWRAMMNASENLLDAELLDYAPIKRPDGKPLRASGGNAVVFRLRDQSRARRPDLAVRCFRSLPESLALRHRAISSKLDEVAGETRLFVRSRFAEQGLKVPGGELRPISWMDWIDGESLDVWVEQKFEDTKALERALRQLPAMAMDLERWSIGHGDLQHLNMLVDATNAIRLIDYDGMYVAALRGQAGLEAGHPDFQHPGRTAEAGGRGATVFHEAMDRFSLITIYLQLFAVARHPALWRDFHDDAGLMLRAADYADPGGSTALRAMKANHDLRRPVEVFQRICRGSVDDVPPLRKYLSDAQIVVWEPSPVSAIAAPPIAAPAPVSPATIEIEATTRGLAAHVGRTVALRGVLGSVRRAIGADGGTMITLEVAPANGKPGALVDLPVGSRSADSRALALLNAPLGAKVSLVGTVALVARTARIRAEVAAVALELDGPHRADSAIPGSATASGLPVTVRPVPRSVEPSPNAPASRMAPQVVPPHLDRDENHRDFEEEEEEEDGARPLDRFHTKKEPTPARPAWKPLVAGQTLDFSRIDERLGIQRDR